jgi:hypothetical protein
MLLTVLANSGRLDVTANSTVCEARTLGHRRTRRLHRRRSAGHDLKATRHLLPPPANRDGEELVVGAYALLVDGARPQLPGLVPHMWVEASEIESYLAIGVRSNICGDPKRGRGDRGRNPGAA